MDAAASFLLEIKKREGGASVKYGINEIVQVLSGGVLISSTWRKCHYAIRDRQLLEPGYYFVLWPAPISSPRV
jgi:hypothetical protein